GAPPAGRSACTSTATALARAATTSIVTARLGTSGSSDRAVHLVLLQLDGAKQVQARERMTRQAALAVAVTQEAVDAPLARAVAGIVRVREGKALEDPELRFDEGHPRRVGGREKRREAPAGRPPA